MDENGNIKILWIWLSEALGSANPRARQLLEAYNYSVTDIYGAEDSDLLEATANNKRLVNRLKNRDLAGAREIYDYCLGNGVGILTPDSELYPARLRRIEDMPVLLYYKGTVKNLNGELCLAVVGTRNMTANGMSSGYSFAYDFGKAGAVVVSGMAKGIDGIAHRAAMDAGGYTVAVLGCGIDRAYPPEHLELMKDIIKNGAVVTEYKPFSGPTKFSFPQRNRIISGMSEATVVIEAPKSSGALITAKTAAEQGRLVFALPGNVNDVLSRGNNDLLRNGAHISVSAADVLLDFRGLYFDKINFGMLTGFVEEKRKAISELRDRISREREKSLGESGGSDGYGLPEFAENAEAQPETPAAVKDDAPPPDYSELPETQKKIMEVLYGTGGLTSDEIALKTGIGTREVLAEITMLEISDMITALPGGMYAVK